MRDQRTNVVRPAINLAIVSLMLCVLGACEVSKTNDTDASGTDSAIAETTKDTEFPDIPSTIGPQDYTLNVLANTESIPWSGGNNSRYVSVCGALNMLGGTRTLTISEAERKGGIPECLTYENRLLLFDSASNGSTKLSDADEVISLLEHVKVMGFDLPYNYRLEVRSRTVPSMAPALLDVVVTSTSAGMTFKFTKR